MQELVKYILRPLVIIGALNWGLIGFFGFDLVVAIFGQGTVLTKIIYSIVGVAAVVYMYAIMGSAKK